MSLEEKPRRVLNVLYHGREGARAPARLLRDLVDANILIGIHGDDHLEAVVCDLRGLENNERGLEQRLARAQTIAPELPLIHLATAGQLCTPRFAALAERHTVVASAPGQHALITMIHRRILHGDRSDEAALRLKAFSLLGHHSVPTNRHPDPVPALMIAAPSPLTLEITMALAERTEICSALSRQQALYALEAGAARALYILAEGDRRLLAAMVKLLRRHSQLSRVPIVVIETAPGDRHRSVWTRAGADAVISPDELDAGLVVTAQGERELILAEDVANLLRETTIPVSADQPHLALPRYFDTALSLRCGKRQAAPFCLGAIRFEPKSGPCSIETLDEVVSYLSMGTAQTDLMVRAAPNLLMLTMPGTDRNHGRRTLRDLEGLARDLKYGPPSHPVAFTTASAVVTGAPSDTPRSLIRSVLGKLAAREEITELV